MLPVIKSGSRTAAPSKMEHFKKIVNGWKPLTIITRPAPGWTGLSIVPSFLPITLGYTDGHTEAYEVVFWYVKLCIFWNFIQDTIHLGKTQMLKKFPSHKINVAKNALFCLSWAPTHRSFTFNLRFLHELKHKGRLSKIACWIFHFPYRFVFIKVHIFA